MQDFRRDISKSLIAALYRGELTVSDESEQKPETGISVILDRGAEQAKQETVV